MDSFFCDFLRHCAYVVNWKQRLDPKSFVPFQKLTWLSAAQRPEQHNPAARHSSMEQQCPFQHPSAVVCSADYEGINFHRVCSRIEICHSATREDAENHTRGSCKSRKVHLCTIFDELLQRDCCLWATFPTELRRLNELFTLENFQLVCGFGVGEDEHVLLPRLLSSWNCKHRTVYTFPSAFHW